MIEKRAIISVTDDVRVRHAAYPDDLFRETFVEVYHFDVFAYVLDAWGWRGWA